MSDMTYVEICMECAINRHPTGTLPALTGWNRLGVCEDCKVIKSVATVADQRDTGVSGV